MMRAGLMSLWIAAVTASVAVTGCQNSSERDKAKADKAVEDQKHEAAVDKAAAKAARADAAKTKPRSTKQVTPPLPVATPPASAVPTPSGLIFTHLTEGTGAAPGSNDAVKIKYSAWRQDGSTFATTEPGNEPTTMYLFSTAPGFGEALQKMKVGGKAMFWLPPEIGYPGTPRGKPETLVYAVELVDLVRAPTTPPDVGKPPRDARKEKSGITWKKIKRNAGGERPRAWDAITMSYTGWDSSGKIVDSSEVHGKPMDLPLESLPAVFADSVPELAVGERARMWFPAELLGKRPGAPGGNLCFEVEIVAVKKLQEPPAAPRDVAAPPADALETPLGVSYQVLTAGTGTQKPAPTDQVSVHYTGWTTDGKRFDSSIPGGQPKQFKVNGVIAGWTDALALMVVGDKWRIWIPEEHAYKGAPQRPKGMLVFDVELLGIDALGAKAPAPASPP